jgi:hypothetical protein
MHGWCASDKDDDDVAGGDDNKDKNARVGLCSVLGGAQVGGGPPAPPRPNDRRHGRAAGPLSHWIGAGGSMVLESDLATGALGEHYVAMANMLHIPRVYEI